MSTHKFKQRITDVAYSTGTSTTYNLKTTQVHVQLCESCSEESADIRKRLATPKWNAWMLKFLLLFVIPLILWIYAMTLVPFAPDDNFDLVAAVYALPPVPIFVFGLLSFTGFREAKHERFNPTSPFLGITSESFTLRNPSYHSLFKQHNPSLLVGQARGETAFSPGKTFTFGVKSGVLISALAIVLVGMLFVSGLPNPDNGNGLIITSISDINDGLVAPGTIVTITGTVDSTTDTWIFLTGDGGSIYVMGTGVQPMPGIEITVTGAVNTANTLVDITYIDY